MEKYVITNLPIKPRKTTLVGMFCTPLIIELLGKLLKVETCLNYNVLNSFVNKKSELNIFKKDLTSNDYFFDKECQDINWEEKLQSHFDFMYKNSFIKEEHAEIAYCECLRVEIFKDKIRDLHNMKIIEERQDGFYCKFCGKKIKFSEEKVLIFYLDENVDDSLQIVPKRLKNSTNHFSKQFKGSKLLISKLRKTGFNYRIGEMDYNIDIDFVLYQTPRLFEGKRTIIVNSERQLLQLYLTNYINNIMGFEKCIFVAHPYIQDISNNFETILENKNSNIKKLTILFNFVWSNPKCVYDSTIYKKLCNYSMEKVQSIYENLPNVRKISIENLNEFEHDLVYLCNVSNNIREYKLSSKNNL